MVNVKWGIISGGAAFILAMVTSLSLGHVGFFAALVRSLGFGAVFFILGAGTWTLINTFIPDLLIPGVPRNDASQENIFAGSPGAPPADMPMVNITVDDTPGMAGGAALPGVTGATHGVDEVENFADLVSGIPGKTKHKDIDQNSLTGYNTDEGEFIPGMDDDHGGGPGGFSLDFGVFAPGSGGMTGLDPEADSIMDSFSLFPDERNAVNDEETLSQERQVSQNKPEKLEGDFSPKEIAFGIRTVLEKEKRG